MAGPHAPSNNTCPGGVVRRTITAANQTLSPDETRYLINRRSTTSTSWSEWLEGVSDIGYNLTSFPQFPTVGFAMGGDGLRGMLFGAGIMNAFDGGNTTAKQKGTGGFLGTAFFQVGSTGASFLPAPLIRGANPRLIVVGGSTSGMLLDKDLTMPGGGNISAQTNQEYYDSILSSVYDKGQAGFQSSLTDIWSRMISYRILNGTVVVNNTNQTSPGGDDLWSDLSTQPMFKAQQVPFPIITVHTQTIHQADAITYEVTPYEMGSYDPRLNAMIPTKYLGTRFQNDGSPDGPCVSGFDQTGFLIGSSSSPFYNSNDGNEPNLSRFNNETANAFTNLLGKLRDKVQSRRYDVGNWPNPFQNLNRDTFSDWNQSWLSVGNAENYLPIDQLMVKARNVNVIVALDATGDTTENKWPDGTALTDAATRIQSTSNQTHQPFPPVPHDFAATGLNLRPSFFGCNATNDSDYPFIIYIPNAPPADGSAPVTNPDSFKTAYSQSHQELFFTQSFLSATSGFIPNELGPDEAFPDCLKCAAVDRARLVAQPPIPRSQICQSCFDRYCYYPDNPPSRNEIVGRQLAFVDPDLKAVSPPPRKRGVQVQLGIGIAAAAVAVAVICVVVFFFWRRRRSARRLKAFARYKWHHDARNSLDQDAHQYELEPLEPLE